MRRRQKTALQLHLRQRAELQEELEGAHAAVAKAEAKRRRVVARRDARLADVQLLERQLKACEAQVAIASQAGVAHKAGVGT